MNYLDEKLTLNVHRARNSTSVERAQYSANPVERLRDHMLAAECTLSPVCETVGLSMPNRTNTVEAQVNTGTCRKLMTETSER